MPSAAWPLVRPLRSLPDMRAPGNQGPTGPLLLDLVPESAWGVNLRSIFPQHWDVLRRDAYRRANYRCECCLAEGRVECHEVWDYSSPPVQRLVRLIALCGSCHSSMHYGLARVRGVVAEVDQHIMRVNGWTADQLASHVEQAFKTMRQRNRIAWRLDVSALEGRLAELGA